MQNIANPVNYKRPALSQRILNSSIIRKFNLVEATQAFAITNTFFLIGVLVFTINGNLPPIVIDFTSLDFGFIFILELWILSLEEPSLIWSLVAGWVVSSIWAKRNYGSNYGKIILVATQLPIFALIILAFLLALLFLPVVGIVSFLLVFSIVQISLLLAALSIVLAIAGLIIANFITTREIFEYNLELDEQFLILNVVPPTPGEKEDTCPFKMKDQSGCAFLGYEAPEGKELICDYKSTWLRCTVYAHIYKSIQEEKR